MRILITILLCGFISLAQAQLQDHKALLTRYQEQAKAIDDITLLISNAADKGIALPTVIKNIQASPTTNHAIFTEANIRKIYNKQMIRLEVLSLYFLMLNQAIASVPTEYVTLLDNGEEIQQPLSEIIDFIDVSCNNALRVLLEKVEIDQKNGASPKELTQRIRNQYSSSLDQILTDRRLSNFYQHKLNTADMMQLCYAKLFDDYRRIIK